MSLRQAESLYPHFSASPGTPLFDDEQTPTLFTPLQIRGLHLQNRIAVSPMGTFSAKDGHLTDFHLVHLGSFALKGAALTIVEATGVTPNGRTSTGDSGLWKDSQIPPLKRIVDFIHSQGQNAGIQLYHSGRKASMLAPWLSSSGALSCATEAKGGWPNDLWAPSAIPVTSKHPVPKAMNKDQINMAVQAFAESAKRAAQAGVGKQPIHPGQCPE